MYFIEKVQKCLVPYFQNRNSEERITLDGAGKKCYFHEVTLCFCTPSPWLLQGICAHHTFSSHLCWIRAWTAGHWVQHLPESHPEAFDLLCVYAWRLLWIINQNAIEQITNHIGSTASIEPVLANLILQVLM